MELLLKPQKGTWKKKRESKIVIINYITHFLPNLLLI